MMERDFLVLRFPGSLFAAVAGVAIGVVAVNGYQDVMRDESRIAQAANVELPRVDLSLTESQAEAQVKAQVDELMAQIQQKRFRVVAEMASTQRASHLDDIARREEERAAYVERVGNEYNLTQRKTLSIGGMATGAAALLAGATAGVLFFRRRREDI
jgi:cob(I)alamin adenosyltransferase